jgi:CrcB protein
MKNYALVAAGGMIGAMARYGLTGWISTKNRGTFPWGTLAVNAIGSFLIGFFVYLALERFSWRPEWRIFFAVGVLGAFTTFSTFSYETVELMRSGSYLQAAANVGANLVGCLAATVGGMALAAAL